MHMTVLKRAAFGAMALAACVALSPAHADDEAEAKPAAEGESADGLPVIASKPEKFFFPLVRCLHIEGCGVKVMRPNADWADAEEGRVLAYVESIRKAIPSGPSHIIHLLGGWLTLGGWSNDSSPEADVKVRYDRYLHRLATDPAFAPVASSTVA